MDKSKVFSPFFCGKTSFGRMGLRRLNAREMNLPRSGGSFGGFNFSSSIAARA